MTPRAHRPVLRPHLAAAHATVRRALAVRHGLRGAGIIAVALAVTVAAGLVLPLRPATAWLRLILLVAASAAGLALAVRSFLRVRPGWDAWLERVEGAFPEVRSWLRNALDLESRPPTNVSAELGQALIDETGRRIEGVPLRTLTPRIEPARPLAAMGAAVAVLVLLGVLSPRSTARAWQTLWSPSAAAPPVTLEVEPGSVRVTPGAALAVRARVWGTHQAPRLQRDGDPAPAAAFEGAGARGERVWRFDLSQLTREQTYRVRVASAISPRYRIALAGEPQAVSFEIEVHAPAYARLPVQKGTATRGDLAALAGSRAIVEALFDRDLTALESTLPGGQVSRWTRLTPRRWRGEVPIQREGEYQLAATAERGRTTLRYRIQPLPDSPPVLAVRTPEGDLDLPAGQQIPIEALGQDDLGLSKLGLEFRKDAASPWTPVPLTRFPGAPREASVQQSWDASALGLLPGETGTFRLVLEDDNTVTGPGRAFSPVFEIRFPALSELYRRIDERQGGAQRTLEKVAEQSRELQKAVDKLTRDLKPSSEPGSFEKSEELKSALQRQQELARQVEESVQQVRESLDMAAERRAFDDRVTRKLQEISQLMDQIQSKELKDAIRRLQEAMQKMDRRELSQTMPQWQKEAEQMLKNLERTAELLKELRQEEKIESLVKRAEDLKAKQDALNQEMQSQPEASKSREADRNSLADRQQKAAQESRELSKDVEETSKELEAAQEKESLEQAAEELQDQAAPEQDQASEGSKSNPQGAQPHGERASQSLQRAGQKMQNTLAQRQQAREGVDLASLRRAAQDLVSMQRETEQNLDSTDPASQRADKQEDLSEGVSRVTDSLQTLSKRTPFIRPSLSQALGRAQSQLGQSAHQFDNGNPQGGEAAGRSGSQALNDAILQLRQTEESMCQNPGPRPGQSKQADRGQTMQRISEQQSKMNRQTQRLSRRLSEQMRLAAGDEAEMRRLAEEQARIREQVQAVQRDEESEKKLLGRLDQTQREMKEVEEKLRQGSLGDALEQQQIHILSRLLDAQRSMNRQDFDPQRESRPGLDVVRASPAELPAELLRSSDRLRLDLMKSEGDRYPAQYRAFVEAYLRALNGSRR